MYNQLITHNFNLVACMVFESMICNNGAKFDARRYRLTTPSKRYSPTINNGAKMQKFGQKWLIALFYQRHHIEMDCRWSTDMSSDELIRNDPTESRKTSRKCNFSDACCKKSKNVTKKPRILLERSFKPLHFYV